MRIEDGDMWEEVKNSGTGFIYNDFGSQFPGNHPNWNTTSFNKLHRARCKYVKDMTFETNGKGTKHHFKTRNEALIWLRSNRSTAGYTLCNQCTP